MNKFKAITVSIILGTFVVWIGWDIILAQNGEATESMILSDWAAVSVFFPNLIGFLCGHWFFRRRNLWLSGWMWALPVWGALIASDLMCFFFADKTTTLYHWTRFPLWYLLVGIVMGSYLWGQGDGDSPIP